MITVIDYGVGNLGSIVNMLRKVGVPATVTSAVDDVLVAKALLLPGVGAFDAAMERLQASGLIPVLNDRVRDGVPLLGVCLGMQLLGQSSEEGQLPGLGWIDARTVRFAPTPGLKIPHMGWSEVQPAKPAAILEGMPSRSRFYFVHSYHVRCGNPDDVLLTADHGQQFHAAVQHGNIHGVQFHPEKSHRFGMWFFRRFAATAAGWQS